MKRSVTRGHDEEFGEPIAEMVYWLSDMEKGRASRILMSAWRLAKAPLRAKLVKCADVIDNTTNILQHDPSFAPIFISDEGPILLDTPLFQEARRTTTIPPSQA